MTKHILFLIGIGVFMMGLLSLPATWPAMAAPNTITVTVNTTTDEFNTSGTGSGCSLREAIQTANTFADFGGCVRSGILKGTPTIVLPGGDVFNPKIYQIALTNLDDNNQQGDFDINASMVISGTGVLPPSVRSPSTRVMQVFTGTVTLKGIEIKDGHGSLSGETGAGIKIEPNAKVTLNHSSVKDSSTNSFGGGIFNMGTLTLIDSLVQGNHAGKGGGGINNGDSGVLTLTRTRVLNNQVISGSATGGGGIAGGGTMTLTDTEISGNLTGDNGGGIKVSGGTTTLINTLVSANFAAAGGGLWNTQNGGTVHIVNSTFDDNEASVQGGAIYQDVNGTINLYNVTVTNNSSGTPTDGSGPGGILRQAGTINVRNSIIAGNISMHNGTGPDCLGTLISQGNNLIGNRDLCTITAQTGDLIGTNATPIDAKLGALANNGGFTNTRALLPGSPAMDAGNSTGCVNHNGAALTTDQRGSVRPTDGDGNGNSRCDMGAYEAAKFVAPTATPTLTPSPTATFTPIPGCTNAPGVPIPTAPKHKSTANSLRPKLNWTDVPCAQTYHVILYRNKIGGTLIQDVNDLLLSEFKTRRLTAGKTYAWQVQACNNHGCSGFSATFKFFTAP